MIIHSQIFLKEKGKKVLEVSSTWAWGKFTSMGEEQSKLWPIPICPNYNEREKQVTIYQTQAKSVSTSLFNQP